MSRALPGAGLVAVGVTLLAVGLFVAWGLSTPPLEEVWRIQIELGLHGGEPLTRREFRLLQDTLRRYPALAGNMVEAGTAGLVSANQDGVVDDGHAYLIRTTPDAPRRLVVKAIEEGVAVDARTETASVRGGAGAHSEYTWLIPNEGPFPQLVEVRSAPTRGSTSGRPTPVLVTLTQ